jgi:malate permease and related proteins
MFIKLFIRILAIFCMIGFGALARKFKMLDRSTAGQMSMIVINFFYPALIFTSLAGNFTLKSLAKNWVLPTGTILIMTTGYLLGSFISRFVGFPGDKTKRQFLFQCTINNYSFLPLPIVFMLWGDRGVAALIFSTLGSEVAVWTLGVSALTGSRLRRKSLKQLLNVPIMSIFISVVVIATRDLIMGTQNLFLSSPFLKEVGSSFFSALNILGKGTIPLAMFIAGSSMADLKPHHLLTRQQGYVVGLRLLVIPAIAVIILHLLPFPLETRFILLVVATMPSAIASVVLGEVYKSDTEFASASVLNTHLFSLITIPLWLSLFLRG